MEVSWMARPTKTVIKKLSQDEFLDLRTGEVRLFNRNEVKQRNTLTLTFRNLKALIRTNFDADNNGKQVFLTLTYRENMQDHRRLMRDWDSFWRKVKYNMPDHALDYIAVAEPQDRGAWHMHVMVKSDKPLFIPKENISEWWNEGPYATRIDALKSDDVGRYYVAYFTDLYGEIGETARKKGARLPFYPMGMKFYRCSQGIKRPEPEEMPYQEAIEGWGEPTYIETYDVKDPETGEAVQTMQREHYKRRGKGR
jgi:hypothetical protein